MQNITRLVVLWLMLAVLLPVVAQDDGAGIDCEGVLEIWQIQGMTDDANCMRTRVLTTENVVTATGDFGFFLQSPAGQEDGDPLTSDGIYVATRFPPFAWGIEAGAHVVIDGGRVADEFGLTQIELSSQSQISVISMGNPIPSPVDLATVDFTYMLDQTHPMERYEGMLVTLVDATVQAPTNRFDEFILTGTNTRAFREPGIEADSTPQFIGLGLPEWDLNPEVFEVDPPEMGDEAIQLTPGATVTVVGGLAYAYSDYQIWPRDLVITEAEFVPRPVRVPGPGEFTVATQNVENLFDTVDDPDRDDSTSEDYVPSDEAAYQLRLGKAAAQIAENLAAPDIVAIQEIENQNVVDGLIARIEADFGIIYGGCIYEGNDGRGIDNAYIYRVDRVEVYDCYRMPGSLEATQFGNNRLYGRPPLVLEAAFLPEVGDPFPVALVNLHIKSLSGIETSGTQERRLMQAEGIAAFVQSLQATQPHVVVLGDMNGFQFSDGLVDVVNVIAGTYEPGSALAEPTGNLLEPALVNQVLKVPEDDRYSYMFNGSYQVLDHILLNPLLDAYVTDVQFSRGNADGLTAWFEVANTPLRSSDHDGLVVYISTE